MEPGETEVVFWAESDAVPGLSIAAPSLRALRLLIDEAVTRHLPRDAEVSLELVASTPESEAETALFELPDIVPARPAGPPIRQVVIPLASAPVHAVQ